MHTFVGSKVPGHGDGRVDILAGQTVYAGG